MKYTPIILRLLYSCHSSSSHELSELGF